MDDKPDTGAIIATVVAGAAVETIWHQIGVIIVGAIGGAFWALMKVQNSTGLGAAFRFIGPRAVFSLCFSYIPALYVQGWLEGHSYKAPLTAVMLGMSFLLACPEELLTWAKPLIRLVRGSKE